MTSEVSGHSYPRIVQRVRRGGGGGRGRWLFGELSQNSAELALV